MTARWSGITFWEPPEWIAPGTDLSFLPPWVCRGCGQTHAGWARDCGRCGAVRPMDPDHVSEGDA